MKGSLRLKAMDERTSHVTEWKATKRTNESNEWTNEQDNTCNSTNGWIYLSLFKTKKSSASLVQNIEKYFWAAPNKISRNWFDNAIEKKTKKMED